MAAPGLEGAGSGAAAPRYSLGSCLGSRPKSASGAPDPPARPGWWFPRGRHPRAQHRIHSLRWPGLHPGSVSGESKEFAPMLNKTKAFQSSGGVYLR